MYRGGRIVRFTVRSYECNVVSPLLDTGIRAIIDFDGYARKI